MIWREKAGSWEMFKQHDHAFVSWQIATAWNPDYFPFPGRKEEVLLAIREHDRAWIPLDEAVRWDSNNNTPYDFTNYPAKAKLAAYKNGIDEVEEKSAYAALLCSRHYTSFFSANQNNDLDSDQFLLEERRRREQIHNQLNIEETEQIEAHLKLLQFCDDLSLYLCLNPPGVKKENEFPWFKNGFRQKFSFAPEGIKAAWVNEAKIELTPFPFKSEVTAELPVYHLTKKENATTFMKSWEDATLKQRIVSFVQH